MKTSNIKLSFLFTLFFTLTFFTHSLTAETFPHTDNFNGSSKDNWSRDDGTDDYLRLNEDKTTYKTFSFGSSYRNASVTVSFFVYLGEDWESGDDFKIYFNDLKEDELHGVNNNWTSYTKSYETNLDSNGDIKIQFSTSTSSSSERAYISYVTIESNAPSIAPVLSASTFSIYNQAPNGTLVGTLSTTPEATTFSILSGDIDNAFAVNNIGEISVNTASLDSNTTSSYTLEINASNSIGYDTEDIIVNLVDDIALTDDSVNTRDFTNVPIQGKDSVTINGSILQIGNQLLCKNSSNGGTCVDPTMTGNTQNNYHTQYYAKIDTSSGAPSNNSMAKLVMEDGDEVVMARLYWSARIENITSTEKTNAKNIQIKGPNASTYTNYTSTNAKYNWHESSSVFDYAASQDVTEYISAQGAGEYYVGGIQAETGKTGTYASWQLVVIVENASRSLKNLTIYDGFYSVYNGSGYPTSVSVDAAGFITPTGTEPFNANLFIYMGESDYGFSDSVKLLEKDGNENVDGDWLSLKDGQNTTSDVVNASIYSPDYTGGYRSNESGMANPNFRNVLGVDIDKLPINVKTDTSQQFLSNSQTETKIKITSAGDRFSLNMFAFETEVFVPEFCYDYAYSQQLHYFTEDNDGTNPPRLTGDVYNGTNDEIEVSIFIKSLVDSSISIENMSVDISDINTTQAEYIDGTTKVAYVGDLIANPVTVTTGTSIVDGSEYIHNIPIGSLDANDYFYVFYQLDPKITTMDMPLTLHASYDLTLDSTSVEYTLKLSEDIPMCSLNNFNYLPPKGIFNVVHNNFYTNTSIGSASPNGTQYYNLPTQVTKREGNFKVISMDPDNLDELQGKETVAVAIEMIDVNAFHYTDASCKNTISSISDRVWVIFENNETSTSFNKSALEDAITNGLTDITSSTDFYTEARQNAAFRTSYNAADSNGSLIELSKDSSTGLYDIVNFPAYAEPLCTQDMNNDGLINDLITGYCPTVGLSKSGVKQCMECLYGLNTKLICSRDNFSIRPESFLLKINDQNQTNPTSRIRLADTVSGVTATPLTTQLQLASGYEYSIEINATNHLNNEASVGYIQDFTATSATNYIEYRWSPTGVTSGCNDTNNTRIIGRISNGAADLNNSVSQVGEYLLSMQDTTWTTVDYNPLYMSHHNGVDSGTYFLSSFTPDCTVGTSDTQAVNSATRNGCIIDSNHNSTGSSYKYRDYNVVFHPYKFGMSSIVASVGLTNALPTATSFIYMADISQDQNMSYHLTGPIAAFGYDDSILSNFTDACYAKPISLNITKTGMSGAVAHQYRFNNTDGIGRIDINPTDINATVGTIHLNTNNFSKVNNGAVNTNVDINFGRNQTVVMNPERVTFSTYTSNCTTSSDCTMNADLISTKTTDGNIILDNNITHFYGKAHAGRKRYEIGTDGPPYPANIYFEVFCFGTIGTNTCDPSLLPSTQRTDDSRWYVNTNHNASRDGLIQGINQVDGLNVVTATTPSTANSSPAVTNLTLNPVSPYKTTMDINASKWLIYNKYDATTNVNQFPVEFNPAATGWSGEADISTTTKDPGSFKTNRRSMW